MGKDCGVFEELFRIKPRFYVMSNLASAFSDMHYKANTLNIYCHGLLPLAY
jgi:hypothetical protein